MEAFWAGVRKMWALLTSGAPRRLKELASLGRLEPDSLPCRLLAVWPQASPFTSLFPHL